jgi:uncharacterized protein
MSRAAASPATSTTAFFAIALGFTWLFLRTRGSLLLAVLLHVGAHLNNPAHAVDSAVPMAIYTAGLAIAAGLTVLLDRRTWSGAAPL